MSIAPPEQIDAGGMINVHARGSFVGSNIDLGETQSGSGAVINLADLPLFFEINGLSIRKALPANPQDSKRRLLPNLSQAELAGLAPGKVESWQIFDESGGHRIPIMQGQIRKYE